MADAPPPPPPAFAALLAFVAGAIDSMGFVALGGLFAAHVTGNFVLIGAAMVHGTGGIVAKLLSLPVFALVVWAVRTWHRRSGRVGHAAALVLIRAKLVLLIAFGVAGMVLGPFPDSDAALAVMTGMLAVCAMAIQNAMMRLSFSTLTPTTVMTGNVTGFMIDVADAVAGTADAGVRARLSRIGLAVAAFALGCAAGAGGYALFGFAAVAAPLAAQLALMVMLRRMA